MIEVEHLSKRYGEVEAVKDVSFTVENGQIVGLLGPNGAGKTTIMKILTCYHFPSQGTAHVDGISVEDDPVAVKRKVGYLPESAPLYGDLTVQEYLSFVAEARELSKSQATERINQVIVDCSLKAVRGKRIDQLSKGYRQRVGLAQAIIHDPSILILDEPTTGLDPNQILEIRDLIRTLGKSKTVILSTHILQEVEAVCSKVLILNEGKIAAKGSSEEIAADLKGTDAWDIAVKPSDPNASVDLLVKNLSSFTIKSVNGPSEAGVFSVSLISEADKSLEGVAGGEAIFDWAVAHQLKLIGMSRKRFSLEDIFVKLTTEAEGGK